MFIVIILYNSLIALTFCSPIVSFFHSFAQLLVARIFKLDIKEISIGCGPIVLMWSKFTIRIIPFWFWVRWDSQKLRKEFCARPLAKNYVKIMWPKAQQTYAFDELSFAKKNCLLLSGFLANFLLSFLIYEWISFSQIYFDVHVFLQSFFHKSFYGLWALASDEIITSQTNGVNLLYSLLMFNSFFMLISFLPIKFFDGHDLWITFVEKITKKNINEVVSKVFYIFGMFWLTWLLCSFLITWQA